MEDAVERFSKAPRVLSAEPWAHLLWNPLNRKMITTARNQRAAEKLLFNSLDGDLIFLKSNINTLKTELAAILNRDIDSLPSYME